MPINIIPRALNVGTGAGKPFESEGNNNALSFRSIAAGSDISVTNGLTDITIANSKPENTTVANVGTGAGLVYRDKTGDQVNLKTVKAGSDITVTNNADDITIANSKPENTTVANVGTGAGLVYRDKTGDQVNLKTVKAGTNITVTNNADDITIAATGGGVSSMSWMDTINGFIFGSANASAQNHDVGTGGTGSQARGWEFDTQFDTAGVVWSLHEGYASGQIQFRIVWIYRNSVASADAQQFQVNMGFKRHDEDIGGGLGSGVYVSMTPTTGAKRVLISDWQNITPNGTYAAGHVLAIRVSREDNNSDYPLLGIIKLKYTINL